MIMMITDRIGWHVPAARVALIQLVLYREAFNSYEMYVARSLARLAEFRGRYSTNLVSIEHSVSGRQSGWHCAVHRASCEDAAERAQACRTRRSRQDQQHR